jgi:hypothetical protein
MVPRPLSRLLLCAQPLRGVEDHLDRGRRERCGCAGRARTRPASRQAKKLAIKAGVRVVEKDDASHTLASLKMKWLQKLQARRKRRAIETMIMAIDNSLAVTGHTYP